MSGLKGNPIKLIDDTWVFVDTGLSVEETWEDMPCGHCGLHSTDEGHDGCIGELPTDIVANACCGHGIDSAAYVQFHNGEDIRGNMALLLIKTLKENVV